MNDLRDLYQEGAITYESAISKVKNLEEFKQLLAAGEMQAQSQGPDLNQANNSKGFGNKWRIK